MEFCISCGGIIPDDAIFCPNCGAAGTKYRLEHMNDGEAAPVVTLEAEHIAEAAEAAEAELKTAENAELADYSFGAERALEGAAHEEQKPESEPKSEARLRNERILNETEAPRRDIEPTEDANRSAIVGFVFSLLPIPFFISPIVGLIVSSVAHRRAKSGLYRNDFMSLAIAGKVISIVRIVLNVIIIAALIALGVLIVYMRDNGLEFNINNIFKQ